MTGYMTKRLFNRGNYLSAARLLCDAYNDATNPRELRTDREHNLQRARARAIRNAKRWFNGFAVISETENGRWFVSTASDAPQVDASGLLADYFNDTLVYFPSVSVRDSLEL